MKKALLFISLILSGLYSGAQNNYNLVIFSEDGEGFYAYVNGIRQNDKPETNIKVIDLNAQALSLRIQFENKSLPVLKQNMMPEMGYEHTLKIKKNTKRVMKLQYFGKVELVNAPRTNAPTVQYHTAENPLTNAGEEVIDENATISTGTSSTASPSVNITVNVEESGNTIVSNTSAAPTNVVVTTATVTPKKNPSKTPKKPNPTATDNITLTNPASATVNPVSPKNPKNTNLSEATHTLTSSSTTIITTTTVTNSSSSSQNGPGKPGSDASIQPVIIPAPANTSCNAPMAEDSFEKLRSRIDDTPFSSAKLSTAKLAVKNACMTSQQIKGICSLLGMDDDKLDYAKYAYSYCYDKANFYQVSEAFSFSGTTDKLNKFLLEK